MDKKKVDVQDFWDKKELKRSWGKIITSVFFVCFGIYFGLYVLDLYMGAHNLTFLKFKINPEFGFVVNGNDEVVYYLSLNDDAGKIFKSEMFDGLNTNEAVNKAIEVAKENNYLVEEKKIEVTVITEDKEEQIKLEDKVLTAVKQKDGSIVSEVKVATEEEIKAFEKITLSSIEKVETAIAPTVDTNESKCDYTEVSSKNMSGDDRYASAINVSEKLYSKGSDSVILINASDLIDGILSLSLSSALNAPILYIDKDNIKDNVMSELERLNPSNFYLIGGTGVISDSVANLINTKFGIAPERIAGKDRYETSINVAKKVDSVDSINSVILVAADNEPVDGALIANISAKMDAPILYTTTNNFTSSVREYIKTDKEITNVYVLGSKFDDTKIEAESKSLGRTFIRIKHGADRYLTNAEILNQFDNKFDSVVIVNNLVDLIPASSLANGTDSALFYMSNSLNVDSQKMDQTEVLSKNKNIRMIYYMGGEDAKPAYRNMLFNVKKLNVSHCENPERELLFMSSKAVFYVPHQDDESSHFGQPITTAIEVLGAENVYLVEFTNGEASTVYVRDTKIDSNNPDHENKVNNEMLITAGYTLDGKPSFMLARDAEFKLAVKELGVVNYKFVEEFDFIDKRFNDKQLVNNKSSVKQVMKYYDDLFDGDVTHFTYTFNDGHSDHKTLGTCLTELYFDGSLDDNKFENVYLISKIDEEDGYNIDSKYKFKHYNVNEDNYTKQKNAFTKYDVGGGDNILGIGYKSAAGVFNDFTTLINENDGKNFYSPMHVPYKK